MSSLIGYAMRFHLDHLQKDPPGELKHIIRDDLCPVRMRMEEFVISGLTNLGLFSKVEAPDYSLDFYFRWRGLK